MKNETLGKKGVKLARYDLIPARPLWLLAEVYGRGAQKYADRNWEKGYEWSKSFQAAQRHLWQWWSGEQFDPEDGQHHLAAAAWHIFALLEYEQTHPENDNRPRNIELKSELLNPEEIAAAKNEVFESKTQTLKEFEKLSDPRTGSGYAPHVSTTPI